MEPDWLKTARKKGLMILEGGMAKLAEELQEVVVTRELLLGEDTMALKSIQFVLPFPPTVNTYWRTWNGRMLISEKGRKYRKDVKALCSGMPQFKGPVRFEVIVLAPDKRRRDLDNLLKAILDSIQHAGVLEDDSQVNDLRIRWGEPRKGGAACCQLEKLK